MELWRRIRGDCGHSADFNLLEMKEGGVRVLMRKRENQKVAIERKTSADRSLLFYDLTGHSCMSWPLKAD